jgi:hypothetical protein
VTQSRSRSRERILTNPRQLQYAGSAIAVPYPGSCEACSRQFAPIPDRGISLHRRTRRGDYPDPDRAIANAILVFRGQRVLLDSTLATMYSVKTKGLNQAVRRNRKRFPTDFMFQLSASEAASLRSQTVTSSSHGGRRFRTYVFTEQGVAMLSSVLRSGRAIAVNIEIMRAFVRLRGIAKSHTDLARKLDELEKKYDRRFKSVFEAIRHLMNPPARSTRRRIGFRTPAMNARSVERR